MSARSRETIPADAGRALLLGAAGLLEPPGRRARAADVQAAVERMGYVQVDTISVVERAHHHILMTRFDAYESERLRQLLERERSLFEHWTHDASVIPVRDFRFWRLRFERERKRIEANPRWRARVKGSDTIERVRERIRKEGPLRSADFEDDGQRSGNWWAWKPAKAALEFLWRVGELAVVGRAEFQKVYDLTERVFAEELARPVPGADEHAEWACGGALERLGCATLGELLDFYRAVSAAEVRRWAERALREGRAIEVGLADRDGGRPRPGLAVPDWRARLDRLPAAPAGMRLLSPFDPVLRDRARAQRAFGFDYRFEAFVPAAKRRYGYYVLPVLEGERLVARLDAKLHRDRGELVVQGLWWEDGVRPTRARQRDLEEAISHYAAQAGADHFVLET